MPAARTTVLAVSIAALGEEVFFRGLVLHGLVRAWARTRTGVVASVVLTALLFAALHSHPGPHERSLALRGAAADAADVGRLDLVGGARGGGREHLAGGRAAFRGNAVVAVQGLVASAGRARASGVSAKPVAQHPAGLGGHWAAGARRTPSCPARRQLARLTAGGGWIHTQYGRTPRGGQKERPEITPSNSEPGNNRRREGIGSCGSLSIRELPKASFSLVRHGVCGLRGGVTMNTRLVMAAAIAALVAGAPGALLAQEAAHAVGGVVRTASGSPVAGAAVSAGAGIVSQTDADGRFTVKLSSGRHTLRVSHPVYADAGQGTRHLRPSRWPRHPAHSAAALRGGGRGGCGARRRRGPHHQARPRSPGHREAEHGPGDAVPAAGDAVDYPVRYSAGRRRDTRTSSFAASRRRG